MANGRFVVLLQTILLITIYCEGDYVENPNEYYRPQIHGLVRYLNQDVNRIYKYNYATLVNAQNKENDQTDLVIDVETECLVPDLCVTDTLTCTGTIQHHPETQSYEILKASCKPKVKLDLNKEEEPTTKTEIEEDRPRIEISHDSEGKNVDRIQPKMVYCLGCPVDINTDVDGVDTLANVALKHIESERDNKLVVLKILGMQRQIVAGVKYTITLEIGTTFCPKTVEKEYVESCMTDTNSPSEICEITYFQQPWITKNKHIIANNCTHSQQFIDEVQEPTTEKNDLENDIDSFFNRKNQNMGGIMSPIRMREMESQIVFKKPVEEQGTTTTESNLSDAQKAAIEDFLDMMSDQPREKRAVRNNNDDSSSSSSSSDDDDDDDNNHDNKDYKTSKSKHKKYRKNNDMDDDDDDDNNDDDNNNDNGNGSSSSSSSSEENDNNNIRKSKNKCRNKREAGGDSSSSESKEVKIEKGDVKINKTSDESSESDEIKLEKDKVKDVSKTSEESSEEIKLREETTTEHDNHVRQRRNLLYGEKLSKILIEEKNFVKNLATFAVKELDDIDNDEHRRVVLKVLGAKKMYEKMYDGHVYYILAKIGMSKCLENPTASIDLNKKYPEDECTLNIMENSTKICKIHIHVNVHKEDPKVLKSHCQIEKQEILSRTHRNKRQIPGGVTEVDSKSTDIKNLAKHVLERIDEQRGHKQKQEIDEILFASKQVVSGLLYKLKIRVKHGDVTKVCDYKVWEQLWMPIKHQVTEKCDNETGEKKYRFKRSYHLLGKDGHDIHIGLFKKFMLKHKKMYKDKAEFRMRFKIFRENMKKVKELNAREQGTAKYGPTFFADMTEKEFAMYKGLKLELMHDNNLPYPKAVIPDIDIPVEFDWRKKGVISEVKNQGQCGSCWAFSVTGNIEGLNAIKTGKMIELSEQELVDCDSLDNGCGGGLMDNAYREIEKLGGLETEQDYPYEAENEKCHFNRSMSRVQISGAVNISTNELDMAKWLVQNGPISIGINANAMQFYMGGISHPLKFLCNSKNIDHGVLLVGYGVHKYPLFNRTIPYWIIKNSWGEMWGEQGYYRVYRGDGTCGVNSMPESAVL